MLKELTACSGSQVNRLGLEMSKETDSAASLDSHSFLVT